MSRSSGGLGHMESIRDRHPRATSGGLVRSCFSAGRLRTLDRGLGGDALGAIQDAGGARFVDKVGDGSRASANDKERVCVIDFRCPITKEGVPDPFFVARVAVKVDEAVFQVAVYFCLAFQ